MPTSQHVWVGERELAGQVRKKLERNSVPVQPNTERTARTRIIFPS